MGSSQPPYCHIQLQEADKIYHLKHSGFKGHFKTTFFVVFFKQVNVLLSPLFPSVDLVISLPYRWGKCQFLPWWFYLLHLYHINRALGSTRGRVRLKK